MKDQKVIDAENEVRAAREMLIHVFNTHALDEFQEGCVRAAVSSLEGALKITALPLGSRSTSKKSQQELTDYMAKKFPTLND